MSSERTVKSRVTSGSPVAPSIMTILEQESAIRLVSLVLVMVASGDTCYDSEAEEQKTLTQVVLKWPVTGARELPQTRSTFCFPARNVGRTGTIVRDRLTTRRIHLIISISGLQAVIFRRWMIQNSLLSYVLRMTTTWITGCPRGQGGAVEENGNRQCRRLVSLITLYAA
jgi:hypothetical protein